MNLKRLFEMQKVLDDRIINEHELQGINLMPNTILALQVELGECANEWRGFKHWSKDQKPRIKVVVKDPLGQCEGYTKYPLLEEYVDALHFFFSIANQIDLPVDELEVVNIDVEGSTITVFTDVITSVGLIEVDPSAFNDAWQNFLMLGTQRLGFTWEQIEEAYLVKNEINHKRQANGY